MQSLCGIKTLHSPHGQENAQKEQLTGSHGISYAFPYSTIYLL
jgi:hypothetical protein